MITLLPVEAVQNISAKVELAPAYNALLSLALLNSTDRMPGQAGWVVRTAAALSADVRQNNLLVCKGLLWALIGDEDWPSLPEYIEALAALDPHTWRDQALRQLIRRLAPDDAELEPMTLLADRQRYYTLVRRFYEREPAGISLQRQVHALLRNPPALQRLVVTHLRLMWERWMAEEWLRVLPVLQQRQTSSRAWLPQGRPAAQTIRAFLGRDLRDDWLALLPQLRRVVFVPSPHLGTYASALRGHESLWVFFGSALRAGQAATGPAVEAVPLITRLVALADEVRLRILELLVHEGELPAQAIIARLQLPQSSASRHLNQLKDAGFVRERRASGASKYYQLVPGAVALVCRALEQRLAVEDGAQADAQDSGS